MAPPSAATSALWPAAHHLYDALLDAKLGYRCKWYLACLIRTPPGGEPMHEGLSRAASFRNSSCIRSLGSVGAVSSSTHFLLHLAARQWTEDVVLQQKHRVKAMLGGWRSRSGGWM